MKKRCRDVFFCAVFVCPVSTPSFCGFWHCHPYIPVHFWKMIYLLVPYTCTITMLIPKLLFFYFFCSIHQPLLLSDCLLVQLGTRFLSFRLLHNRVLINFIWEKLISTDAVETEIERLIVAILHKFGNIVLITNKLFQLQIHVIFRPVY